uniref:Uncharacterized protein n=1 Tax=viral metagenome TaxID=1070528 RepID=A0A6M3J972_9ZZZZ
MIKPEYELVPLRDAIAQCRANILAFQNAVDKEEGKIDELLGYINKWNEYNKWVEDGDTSRPNGES